MAGICIPQGSIHCVWLCIVSLLLTRNKRDLLLALLACTAGAYLGPTEQNLFSRRPKWEPIVGAATRERVATECKAQLSPKTYGLFAAIFLGQPTTYGMQDHREQFSEWGIVHQLARSGLHLVILLALARWCLGFIPLWYGLKVLILLALVALYGLLSWPSISFVRACITCFVYCLFELFFIPVTALQVVTLVTLLVLVQNPAQLFFLDFQLSFGLTFALALMSHVRKIL